MLNAASDDRRFEFGENWLDFARDLSAAQIAEAEKSVRELLARDSLDGLRLLDIGCGSGLFSLAARRLGARVHSFDLDPSCVTCTERLRDRHLPGDRDWVVEQGSVLDPVYLRGLGRFDVVYSWGVLHHTGALRQAIAAACALVAPGGLFACALYRRTLACPLWRLEKRWYAHASPAAQRRARAAYIALFRLACLLTGRDFTAYVTNYRNNRGMSFVHDVHDWMGGYPYESVSAPEVDALLRPLDFECLRAEATPLRSGILGSGCAEYLYRRSV